MTLLLALVGCAPSVANRSAPRVDSPASSASAGDPTASSSTNTANTNAANTNAANTNAANTNAANTNAANTNAANTNAATEPRTNQVARGSTDEAAIDSLCTCLLGTEGRFELVGTITGRLPQEIPEASGMVTSRFDDAVLWTHNDSGYDAVLFAVHEDGTLLSRVELATSRGGGLTNRDFEDLAAGPCDARDRTRSCLYVGDFGDNELRATSIHVHRLREPDPRAAPSVVARVETMELTFPDGARDTEAMVVDDRGTVFLLTKRPPNGRFRLYSAPFRAGARTMLTLHGEVSLAPLGMIASMSMFTAADLHPRCGLIGAYYGGALAVRVEQVEQAVDAALVPLPTGRGLQNEAIAFTSDGYRHAIEGEGAAIHRFRCTLRN